MAHENKVNWGGEVQSAGNKYEIEWRVSFDSSQPVTLDCQFTIRHGWRGPHVAKALADHWNKKYKDGQDGPLAAANGSTVDFADHVNTMEYRRKNPNHPNSWEPVGHGCRHVVDELYTWRD